MLLHRVAQRVIVRHDVGPDVQEVRGLAARRGVPVEVRDDLPFACVGLMRAAGR
jgi:hypothetical protein